MPDYSKSKIYKLQCNDGYFYIGSTCDELRKRLYYHKQDCKKQHRINTRVYKHINSVNWDNVTIILIEQFNCENKDELRMKENEYIQKELNNELCLNTNRSYRTSQDDKDDKKQWREENKDYMNIYIKNWREQNKDRMREQSKKWREEHKDYIKNYMKEYYEKNKSKNNSE